jgi:hypothetical protein
MGILLQAARAENASEHPLAAAESAHEHPFSALHLAAVPPGADPGCAAAERTLALAMHAVRSDREAPQHFDVGTENRARQVVVEGALVPFPEDEQSRFRRRGQILPALLRLLGKNLGAFLRGVSE